MTDTDPFDMTAAPMHVAGVRLAVRDPARVAGFYEEVLGLARIAASGRSVTLGAGSRPLVTLLADPGLSRLDPRQAGLFHTAFLLPSRADLGRWLRFALARRVPLQGASDHIVSEAVYLADPEGNGVEIYADRPGAYRPSDPASLRMATDPLDAEGLLAAAEGTEWDGFVRDGIVGHVHLQVGDTKAADAFYAGVLGFDVSFRYPGASFYGSGGYHHHLAGNVWNSRGAGRRPSGMTGLDRVDLSVRTADVHEAIAARARTAGLAVTAEDGTLVLSDPWGTRLGLTPAGER